MLGACGGSSSNAFFSKGGFTASGAHSGVVSASFTGMSSYLFSVVTSQDYVFRVGAIDGAFNGDGTSTGTFTSPSGVTTYTVSANIDFTGPPTTGMTLTNSNSCGDVSISYGSAAVSKLGDFEASGGSNCVSVADAGAGSWTLTFTSVPPPEGESGGDVYFPHGTFVATMPDGLGDTGMVNFSF